MLSDRQDAFGHSFQELHRTGASQFIVERDDGLINAVAVSEAMSFDPENWSAQERAALEQVHGRVLDIGCGAGRHALYLQSRGFDVTGVDDSPLAVEVSRERGLRKAVICPITRVTRRLGEFDTLIMLGNNFCLVGNPKRARWLLRRFHVMTSNVATLIAQSRDPRRTDNPDHLAYHAKNRAAGRMPGYARIRVRYGRHATPWIDFLMVSPEEMTALLEGTGWHATRFLDGEDGVFTAIIRKDP